MVDKFIDRLFDQSNARSIEGQLIGRIANSSFDQQVDRRLVRGGRDDVRVCMQVIRVDALDEFGFVQNQTSRPEWIAVKNRSVTFQLSGQASVQKGHAFEVDEG